MAYNFQNNRGYKPLAQWVDAGNGWVPCGKAVVGGYDVSGENLYIGRVQHEGDIIPGKIVMSHNCCYVAHGGKEHSHHYYQALVAPQGCEFVWVPSGEGVVPTGAIQGGVTRSGEKLFIGRVRHEGSFCIGKVQPSHHTCYISFGGQEHGHRTYEVLCVKDIPLEF